MKTFYAKEFFNEENYFSRNKKYFNYFFKCLLIRILCLITICTKLYYAIRAEYGFLRSRNNIQLTNIVLFKIHQI